MDQTTTRQPESCEATPAHGQDSPRRFAQARQARQSLARRKEETTIYRPVTLLYMAGMVAMLVPLLTLVDIPLTRYFASTPFPNELVSAIELTLVFSNGSGVFFLLVAILLLAPQRRWHVPRLATLALGGSALATIIKMFVIRPRPQGLTLDHASHDIAWWWAFDWDLSQIAMFDASTRAFPSGHVVTATALTIGLWVTLPRGRVLFAMVWLGVLLQRLVSGAHFLSDVGGGVAIGLFWGYVCYCPPLLGNMFEKLVPERSTRRRFDPATVSVSPPLIPPPAMTPPAIARGTIEPIPIRREGDQESERAA